MTVAPWRTAAVVAFYDATQPALLTEFITELQALVAAAIPGFRRRDPHRVHTTLVGLDGLAPVRVGGERAALRAGAVDVGGFVEHLVADLAREPLRLRLSGFAAADRRPFSRGRPPFERNLDVVNGQLVLVGWPVQGDGVPTMRLDRLRRAAASLGIVHRYPLARWHTDPDAHLVIGEVPDPSAELTGVLADLRRSMSRSAFTLPLVASDLQFVFYDDPELPLDTTVRLPLAAGAAPGA